MPSASLPAASSSGRAEDFYSDIGRLSGRRETVIHILSRDDAARGCAKRWWAARVIGQIQDRAPGGRNEADEAPTLGLVVV